MKLETKVMGKDMATESSGGIDKRTPEQHGAALSSINPGKGTTFVSVIILYYKRRETIEETIQSALKQDYPYCEIIVVDNHSQDGFRDWLDQKGYSVKVVEAQENRGACGGRNLGIAAAQGDVLVFLDDDMSLMSPMELTRVVEDFESHPNAHVLAFQICDPDSGKLRLREWCHPYYWKEFSEKEFETMWFCEGASAFRREVFDACGGYYEPLFYGAEGHDLVLRLLDHGFRILHAPRVRAGHRPADEGRSLHRQYYYWTRNYFWMSFKDYQFWDGLRFFIPRLLMMCYFTVRTSTYRSFFQGIRDGIRGLAQVRRDRTPISKKTVRYLAKLEEARPSLRVRLAKHKSSPQL